ncbi:STAS domain-containing protein [Pseudalkalibacillus hwajinpoensis]|uniref:STAS domain-containing protein n=1 Tax=Guptibacillus hwajinpoensis TaxID=208199 RepID=UPI00325B7ACC
MFGRFAANIVVSEFLSEFNQKIGYLLVWRYVTEKQKDFEENKKLVNELSTAVIPTIIDNAILVPCIGKMTDVRSERLVESVLNYCATHGTDYVLFDFSDLAEMGERSARILCETMTKYNGS